MTLVLKAGPIVESIEQTLTCKIKALPSSPRLAIVMIGEHKPSQIYTKVKQKACTRVGIHCSMIKLPDTITTLKLQQTLEQLNHDGSIDGILLQLPLPAHLPTTQLLNLIDPQKDVDGLGSIHQGNLWNRTPQLIPCTPKGILTMIDHYGLDIEGKNTVILGESTIVGRPLGALLLNRFATVTLCHIKTQDLQKHVNNCDLLVSATGVKNVIPASWIPDHCIVFDVGIHNINGQVSGDLDHSNLVNRVHALTPVPGGVGPMTVASLLENTLISAQLKQRSSR